jgi:UDP:flavonoid glycosyltransferase YjiC (YdhE family)
MRNNGFHTVLLAWELGSDLGHVARLRPLARALVRRGHEVVLAARNLENVAGLPERVRAIQAPTTDAVTVTYPIREPATFADILYNTGAGNAEGLWGLVDAWHEILDRVEPDVVVHDFSPFALLAALSRPVASVLLGTGFACPPPIPRLPDLRAWQDHYPDRIRATEDAVLSALNSQLEKRGQAPLAAVGELFARADENLLTTFPELDHYPQRQEMGVGSYEYIGTWSDLGGPEPAWPQGQGPRIFAYLKPFKGLPRLLEHLMQAGYPTLVFLPGDMDVSRWQSSSMRIVKEPLNMGRVAATCDLAVLHAGHGSTAAMLLAGKPIVQIPFVVEQYHTAQNTDRLGAGIHAALDDPDEICRAVDRAASDHCLKTAAEAFARKYADHDSQKALSRVVERIEKLAYP